MEKEMLWFSVLINFSAHLCSAVAESGGLSQLLPHPLNQPEGHDQVIFSSTRETLIQQWLLQSQSWSSEMAVVPVPLKDEVDEVVVGNPCELVSNQKSNASEVDSRPRPAHESIWVVLQERDSNSTLALFSRCKDVPALRDHLVTWILVFEFQPQDKVEGCKALPRFFEFLQDKFPLKLTDRIYVTCSGCDEDPITYEVYGVKDHTFVKSLSVETNGVYTNFATLGRRRRLDSILINVAHVLHPSVLAKNGKETLREAAVDPNLTYEIFAYTQDWLGFHANFQNASTWMYVEYVSPSQEAPERLGMADLIMNGSADLALSNVVLFLTSDFSYLFVSRVYKEIYIYYHEPRAGESGSSSAVPGNVFEGLLTWYAIIGALAMILVTTLCGWVFFHSDVEAGEVLVWSASVFTLKSAERPAMTHETPGRIYALSVGCGCVLFYAILSGSLLVKFSSVRSINNVADLLDRGYNFHTVANGVVDHLVTHDNCSEVTTSPLRLLYGRYKRHDSEADGIIHTVNNPRAAYIGEANAFVEPRLALASGVLVSQNCARLRTLKLDGDKRWGSDFVKLGSELKDHFNYGRIRMVEVGIWRRAYGVEMRVQDDARPVCQIEGHGQRTTVQERLGLHLADSALAFSALGACMVLSLVLLLRERWRNQ